MYLLHIQRWSLLALTFGAALLSYSAFAEQQTNEPPVVWGWASACWLQSNSENQFRVAAFAMGTKYAFIGF